MDPTDPAIDLPREEEAPPSSQNAHNQVAWDRLAIDQHVLARPAEDSWFENPLASVDRQGWLGPSIAGWHVLCLAAGGGAARALVRLPLVQRLRWSTSVVKCYGWTTKWLVSAS